MAENNLEEFDDLDNLLDNDDGESGDGGEFSEELDNLLGGDEDLGDLGDGDEGGGDAGGGDSELDSFFEDLSTIDDLEVLQEDEDLPVADVEDAPAAAAAAAEPEAAPAAAAAPVPQREPGSGSKLKRLIVLLISLGILGGGGYAIYLYLFPSFEIPWPVAEEEAPEPPKLQEEPPPPPPAVMIQPQPPPPPPRVVPVRAPVPKGPTYGIQVATCLTSRCVNTFKNLLARNNQEAHFRIRKGRTETLELVSRTGYRTKAAADELAVRINRGHRMEGNAFVFKAGDAYRISMGNFSDLSRANAVRDSLAMRFSGELVFSTRLVRKPYRLRAVITGRYVGRESAGRALQALRSKDLRFHEAFIVRN